MKWSQPSVRGFRGLKYLNYLPGVRLIGLRKQSWSCGQPKLSDDWTCSCLHHLGLTHRQPEIYTTGPVTIPLVAPLFSSTWCVKFF
jgi:hypothetical protein